MEEVSLAELNVAFPPSPATLIMLFAASSINEAKPVFADHMMVKHSVPEMIF